MNIKDNFNNFTVATYVDLPNHSKDYVSFLLSHLLYNLIVENLKVDEL